MTDSHQRARLEHIALAGRRAHLDLRIAEQHTVVRRVNLITGDPTERRQRVADQIGVLRLFQSELRKLCTQETAALVALRQIKNRKDNPPVPGAAISLRPPPLPGRYDHIDLEYVEAARKWVWEARPYRDYRGSDYDPATKSFPPDPDGLCRHKAAWLAKLLGGRVLLGYRTDEPDAGPTPSHWQKSTVRSGCSIVTGHGPLLVPRSA
jgi:hypothetical protein